jgi:hypothetical protein
MSMLPVRRSCLDRRQTVGTPRRARPGLSPSARSGARAPGASCAAAMSQVGGGQRIPARV